MTFKRKQPRKDRIMEDAFLEVGRERMDNIFEQSFTKIGTEGLTLLLWKHLGHKVSSSEGKGGAVSRVSAGVSPMEQPYSGHVMWGRVGSWARTFSDYCLPRLSNGGGPGSGGIAHHSPCPSDTTLSCGTQWRSFLLLLGGHQTTAAGGCFCHCLEQAGLKMRPTEIGRARNEQKEISDAMGAAGYSKCQKQHL